MEATIRRIEKLLSLHPALLFMRGTPERPMCAGSAAAVAALEATGEAFHAVDIQADPQIRAFLPKHSDQKGYPQLFLQGELIGGMQIVCDLGSQGELKQMLQRCQPLTALAS